MIGLLINLLVLLIVAGLLWWIIQQLTLPDPIPRIAQVVVVVIVVLAVVYMLLGVAGEGPVLRLR